MGYVTLKYNWALALRQLGVFFSPNPTAKGFIQTSSKILPIPRSLNISRLTNLSLLSDLILPEDGGAFSNISEECLPWSPSSLEYAACFLLLSGRVYDANLELS